jgi:hypothetical protein
LSAYQIAAQVHQHVVEVEHAQVPGEPFHTDRRLALGDHQVEQVVRTIEPALTRGCHLGPELVGDVAQRALEVRRELAGVASGGATTHPVALHQKHPLRGVPQGEERRRHARNAGTHDHDVGQGVLGKRPGRTVCRELSDPGRPGRLVLERCFARRGAVHAPGVNHPHACNDTFLGGRGQESTMDRRHRVR